MEPANRALVHVSWHMSIHRGWLALIAALLTPWFGPHIDRCLPVGWVLSRAYVEAPDAGFWVIAGGCSLSATWHGSQF